MNDTKAVRAEILADLDPLFREAHQTGKWFHCNYQDLWFSPEELAKHHENGQFIWGAVNWQLRDPMEMLEAAEKRARDARAEVDRIRERINSASPPA